MFFGFFGFGNFFYAILLIFNAIAVLSEDRFLARIGLTAAASNEQSFGAQAQDPTSVKGRVVVFINSVRTLMRLPLILVNTVIMIYEILSP